jgi:hypothetical protein
MSERHTAESLAGEFLGRANEFGWLRLSAKQGAWLWNLATREQGHEGAVRRGSLQSYLGVTGSRTWKLVKESNGSWTIGWERLT